MEKEILMESSGKCKSSEEKQILALLRTRGEGAIPVWGKSERELKGWRGGGVERQGSRGR